MGRRRLQLRPRHLSPVPVPRHRDGHGPAGTSGGIDICRSFRHNGHWPGRHVPAERPPVRLERSGIARRWLPWRGRQQRRGQYGIRILPELVQWHAEPRDKFHGSLPSSPLLSLTLAAGGAIVANSWTQKTERARLD